MNGTYTDIKNRGLDSANVRKPRAAIYCRLSKDDDDRNGDSSSIQNQKEMLENFCNISGWEIVGIYQDDGYTGLNMNRPDFQRLIERIGRREIDVLVTKDISRLSRNRLDIGNLTEKYFPKNGVRYVAMLGGVDTQKEDHVTLPLMSMIAEMYSADTSQKVHSAYESKARKGDFTGTVAPIGYKKSKENKYKLEPDEETAPIIRLIFEMAKEGHGVFHIRRKLEELEIPTPAWWHRQRGYRSQLSRFEVANPETGRFAWDCSTLKTIIQNPVYIGTIASQKQEHRFKTGWIRDKKPHEWIQVENMHEPIISRETFDLVQEKIKNRSRPCKFGNYSLFAGLVKCGRCGQALVLRDGSYGRPVLSKTYVCALYNRYGKKYCSVHRITYDLLYHIVLVGIREQARFALADEEDVVNVLSAESRKRLSDDRSKAERSIFDDTARLAQIERVISKLYEDYAHNQLNADNLNALLGERQAEQTTLKSRIADNKAFLEGERQKRNDNERWLTLIRDYTEIEALDRTTVNLLINKIVVYDCTDDTNNGGRSMVEIFFNFTNQSVKYDVLSS